MKPLATATIIAAIAAGCWFGFLAGQFLGGIAAGLVMDR